MRGMSTAKHLSFLVGQDGCKEIHKSDRSSTFTHFFCMVVVWGIFFFNKSDVNTVWLLVHTILRSWTSTGKRNFSSFFFSFLLSYLLIIMLAVILEKLKGN